MLACSFRKIRSDQIRERAGLAHVVEDAGVSFGKFGKRPST